jgi:hydrogenase-4 component B
MHDKLSIFFMFLIIIIFIPIAIYSIGYKNEYKKYYSVKYMIIMMLLFVFSMLGVVFATNGITFLVFWEIMSTTSFFLVIYEYRKKENLKAGNMYFIMTHISGIFLMLMFAFLYKFTGSFDFKVIAAEASSLTITEKSLVFIMAFIGFGAKAGILPVHAWLPKAHPAAPSNVSALMSGVMLKIAMYGFIRVVFCFLGTIPVRLGLTVMILGTVTAIFSILNALMQKDIKKLLAYSSAENIGLIFAALGLSMVFSSNNLKVLASLALTAALFHIINHAVFKSLLFLNAGSVLYATGSKNMNELGGLYKNMKFVAICAFIGSAAISAIPPLNGFASEILIFKSFIEAGASINNTILIIVIFACGVLLALTSGAALYSAVKCFAITFLGKPRSEKAIEVKKIPFSMNLAQGILSALVIIFGVLSPFVITVISKLSRSILNLTDNAMGSLANETQIIAFSMVLILTTASLLIFNKLITSKKKEEINETWSCGYNRGAAYIQYTGSGFSQPAAKMFGKIALFRKFSKEVKKTGGILIKQKNHDIIEKDIYIPITQLIDYISEKILKIHHGKIQIYISYLFISLIFAFVLLIKFI